MEDRCIFCGADVSDQGRWYCSKCEVQINNLDTAKQSLYKTKFNRYINRTNVKPIKCKFTSFIQWFKRHLRL